MSRVCHEHCPPEGGALALVAVVVVAAVAYVASVILASILVELLVFAVVAVGGLTGVLIHLLHRDGLWIRMPAAAPVVAEPREWKRRALTAAPARAIEAPRAIPATIILSPERSGSEAPRDRA